MSVTRLYTVAVHSAFHGKDVRMLHHLSLGVRDLVAAGAFYDAALGALGTAGSSKMTPRSATGWSMIKTCCA